MPLLFLELLLRHERAFLSVHARVMLLSRVVSRMLSGSLVLHQLIMHAYRGVTVMLLQVLLLVSDTFSLQEMQGEILISFLWSKFVDQSVILEGLPWLRERLRM